MELSALEMTKIDEASRQSSTDAIKELAELQLMLVGGGCEVSFN